MSKLVFGQVALCKPCDGMGRVKMTKERRNARARELRRAKAANDPPPAIQGNCKACDGRGYV